ncbi:hypothetical protein J4470_03775 [Candidatus Woesearchaeota archaeon]|nr:hypothetical protein [Candidatus Woesearchaeota archaeon]
MVGTDAGTVAILALPGGKNYVPPLRIASCRLMQVFEGLVSKRGLRKTLEQRIGDASPATLITTLNSSGYSCAEHLSGERGEWETYTSGESAVAFHHNGGIIDYMLMPKEGTKLNLGEMRFNSGVISARLIDDRAGPLIANLESVFVALLGVGVGAFIGVVLWPSIGANSLYYAIPPAGALSLGSLVVKGVADSKPVWNAVDNMLNRSAYYFGSSAAMRVVLENTANP